MLIRKKKTISPDGSENQSLWFRLMSFSAVWTFFALMLGGYLLSLTFQETIESNFDDRLDGLLENLVGISGTTSEGEVSFYRAVVDPRFEQPYSGWYWQVSAIDMAPYRSRSLWDQSLEPNLESPAHQTRYSNITGPEDQKLRMVERDITIPGETTVFRFSIAVDRSEIEAQRDRFDSILIYSLSALGLGLIAASLLQVYLGLKPLRNIQRTLAKVRSGEVAHLPKDFPAEIQPLVDEMNALLDHNNEIVERSRTQVGNLAHALKTPLAVLMNEASLHKGALADVAGKQADTMRRQVEHYLRRARVAATTKIITSRCDVTPVLADISRAMTLLHKDKKFSLHSGENPQEFQFRGERQDLEEMVGNLIENAAKWASHKIDIACARNGDQLIIQVSDDGPGIDKAVRDSVFMRGERLDEETPGTGLGLSIVKELSELYGGEVTLLENEPHGLLARLILPAARS
ncbi:sensor histidine kinase [Paremcibacter congregatus]|nr:HAMP domain-containing sensor histidine kinase [Paremcibacter congregatus]QDE26655.1 HAMP domain-containing histidine kinase [Paremcibacter congregatus]